MKLTAEGLGWHTRDRPIITDISLEIPSGQTFGLIGPNGSGKSTLLLLLAGLRRPSTGEVRLDDRPIRSLSRRDIAQRLAFVEQHAETGDSILARDVVGLGRTPWLSALAPFGAQDRNIVDDALSLVGMSGMGGRDWTTLSGGERQRLQIARALAQRPRLLMLDEPTNHLDIHHQLSLLRLVADLPLTVVMSVHDLNQAMGCDRLGVMSDGRLVACGTPGEVLTPRLLRDTFRVGATLLRDPLDDARMFRFHCLEN